MDPVRFPLGGGHGARFSFDGPFSRHIHRRRSLLLHHVSGASRIESRVSRASAIEPSPAGLSVGRSPQQLPHRHDSLFLCGKGRFRGGKSNSPLPSGNYGRKADDRRWTPSSHIRVCENSRIPQIHVIMRARLGSNFGAGAHFVKSRILLDCAARRSKVTVCSHPALRPSSAMMASAKSGPPILSMRAVLMIES